MCRDTLLVCQDAEDASGIDQDFFNALALLHSTEDDSAEKLRKMLDTSIQRRYGFDKTLIAKMPKKFLQNTKIRGKSFANSNEKSEISWRKGGNDKALRKTGSLSLSTNNTTEINWKPMKIFDANIEDCSEKGDIPRISIPDEGSGDGLLCKICNGAKLGPLILLECQECQEVYHPLCHQPPVVDIDVYDPRIVWRCKTCMDTYSLNSVVASDEKKVKRSRPANDEGKAKEPSAKVTKSGKLNGYLVKDETDTADQTSSGSCYRLVFPLMFICIALDEAENTTKQDIHPKEYSRVSTIKVLVFQPEFAIRQSREFPRKRFRRSFSPYFYY